MAVAGDVLHPNGDFDQITVAHPELGEIILVNTDQGIRAYENSCPHVGVGLDYGDGSCLVDGELICSMHGARFRPEDGYCTAGPPAGASLKAIPVAVGPGGEVRLA